MEHTASTPDGVLLTLRQNHDVANCILRWPDGERLLINVFGDVGDNMPLIAQAKRVMTAIVEAPERTNPVKLSKRIFEFSTGDEVDVDKIISIDANAASSIAHFTLGHGSFLRVRFGSDDERRQQLAALRAFRGRV